MNTPNAAVVVVDDDRTFTFPAMYLRTTDEAVAYLETVDHIDELWLDHDLCEPGREHQPLEVLERRAVIGPPLTVGRIVVHSQNPSGADTIVRSLQRRGYNVQRTSPTPHLAGDHDR